MMGNKTKTSKRAKRIYPKIHKDFSWLLVNYETHYCADAQEMVNQELKYVKDLLENIFDHVWPQYVPVKISKKEVSDSILHLNAFVELFVKKIPNIIACAMWGSRDSVEEDDPSLPQVLTADGYKKELSERRFDFKIEPYVNDVEWGEKYSQNPIIALLREKELRYYSSKNQDAYVEKVISGKKPIVGNKEMYAYVDNMEQEYWKNIGNEKSRWGILQSPYLLEKTSKDPDSDYKTHLRIKEEFKIIKTKIILGQFYHTLPSGKVFEELDLQKRNFIKTTVQINDLYGFLATKDSIQISRTYFKKAYFEQLSFFKILEEQMHRQNLKRRRLITANVYHFKKNEDWNFREIYETHLNF